MQIDQLYLLPISLKSVFFIYKFIEGSEINLLTELRLVFVKYAVHVVLLVNK